MSQHSARAEANGSARVAVVGAASPAGGHVREALAGRKVSGRRVDLYGATGGSEAVLSEYGGEARLIQEPDPAEILDHDVVFLCEPGEAAGRIAKSATGGALVIDVVGGVASRDALPIHLALNADKLERDRGCLAVPHPLAILLAELLHPLQRRFGVRRSMGVVLRPAADFGQQGIDELREQAVRLLNFARAPREVFGRQLVFNLLPQGLLEEPDLEPRISVEVTRLLGWVERRLTLKLITVPVFYGHTIALRVRLESDVEAADVVDALSEHPELDPPSEKAAWTPIDAGDGRRTCVSEVCEDGLGGFWLWVVAGQAEAAAAESAVRLAGTLLAERGRSLW